MRIPWRFWRLRYVKAEDLQPGDRLLWIKDHGWIDKEVVSVESNNQKGDQ